MARNPLHTKLCDMFGIEFPIFAFTHCKDVVAEVVNAGGMGILGELSHTADEIHADIQWLRERVGNKPFGIDLVFPASIPQHDMPDVEVKSAVTPEHWQFVNKLMREHNLPELEPQSDSRRSMPLGLSSLDQARKQLEVLLDERVPLFAAGLGSPAFVLDAAHARGIKVAGLIGRTRQARREIEAGIDIVIAQGYDAGGHTGEIGTFSLVPAVVKIAGETPVLAAGGVGTGRHLAAALCLGAAGVWTGTIWLATRESNSDIRIKEKIVASTEDDTIRSRALTGKPARQLRNAWNLAWEAPDAPKPLPAPLQFVLSNPVLAAARQAGNDDFLSSPAGQAIGTVEAIKPSREVVLDIVGEALDVLEGVTGVPAEAGV
jgi:NAD(P)H-dependent flavin oxidoreductase YrpB (nitropropane dioxygenase family)